MQYIDMSKCNTSSESQLRETYDSYLETYLPERKEFRSYAGKPHTKVLASFRCAYMLPQ